MEKHIITETISSFGESPKQEAKGTDYIKKEVDKRANSPTFLKKFMSGEGVILVFGQTPISSQAKSKTKVKKYLQSLQNTPIVRNSKYKFKGKKLKAHLVFFLTKDYLQRDLDNLTKLILDSMKGYVFEDDGQICEQHIEKLQVPDMDPNQNPELYEQTYCYICTI